MTQITTSSLTGKRLISIKDLSLIQKTALYWVAPLLDLHIVGSEEGWIQNYSHQGPQGWPNGKFTVTLAPSTTKDKYSTQLSELTSLFATMESLNSGGWLGADLTSGT